MDAASHDKPFVPITTLSPFQSQIAKCLNSKFYQLNSNYLPLDQKIVFTENQVRIFRNLKKHGRKESSLQRLLLDNTLYRLGALIPTEPRVVDIAGCGYDRFFPVPFKCYHTINIAGEPTFHESAEGECQSVSSDAYHLALCLNYLLLAQKPEQVIRNAFRFLAPGGFAIFDFISLTYWVCSRDGYHYQSFTPYGIQQLLAPVFSEFVLIPIGNWFQGTCNYYAKMFGHFGILRRSLVLLGKQLGFFDRNPASAIHYLVVARKQTR